MKVEFSVHALERMDSRGILKKDVLEILQNYDSIAEQDNETKVYSKLVHRNNKQYIYRVFINTIKNPALVITVYRTSKIEKYGY